MLIKKGNAKKILLFITSCLLFGCLNNTKTAFTGKNPPYVQKIDSIFVTTGIPVFGSGTNIVIKNDELIVQVVASKSDKLYEIRYKRALLDYERTSFEYILNNSNFSKMNGKRKNGRPDEVMQKIVVRFHNGKEVIIKKWAGEKHKGFDNIMDYFLEMSKLQGTDEVVYTGLYSSIIPRKGNLEPKPQQN